MSQQRFWGVVIALMGFLVQGCAVQPVQPSEAFLKASPLSILVLPPTNQSNEPLAPYTFLSTTSQPLAEQGYYVFPVMVVDAFMKGNGMQIPEEMHQIPLDKLHDVFGQDAVLYIDILDFGQEYVLLSSNTVVRANARLIHSKTGAMLWEGTVSHSEGSGDGGGGIAGMMVAALVDQVMDSMLSRVRDVSIIASRSLFQSPRGLPPGPYLVKRQAELASQKADAEK